MIICSKKQKTTLVLFAMNYSLPVISERMGVCLSTTRNRLQSLSRNHSIEFYKALSIREVFRSDRDAIRNVKTFTDLGANDTNDDGSGFRTPIENISQNTKYTF